MTLAWTPGFVFVVRVGRVQPVMPRGCRSVRTVCRGVRGVYEGKAAGSSRWKEGVMVAVIGREVNGSCTASVPDE